MTRLIEVLEHERRSLQSRDAAALRDLAAEKQRLAARLDALRHERAGPHGIDALRAASPGTRQRLEALADSARRLNQANGAIIDAASRYTRRAIDVIFWRRPAGAIYGRAGELRHMTSARYSSSA